MFNNKQSLPWYAEKVLEQASVVLWFSAFPPRGGWEEKDGTSAPVPRPWQFGQPLLQQGQDVQRSRTVHGTACSSARA